MRLKFFISMFISCFLVTAYGQKVDNDSLINNMKSAITTFFIKEGILKKDEVKSSLNFIFATELKQQNTLGYSLNGIYRIGVFQSHSEEHILIKENLLFKIFDIKEINVILKEVIDYSIKNKIETDTMLYYVKNIMDMYDMNYKTIPNGGGLMKKVK
jgi:hypothetical protein